MGISRKCVKTWLDRYAAEGEPGLVTGPSRPHSSPTRTRSVLESRVVAIRAQQRCGREEISARPGVPARTVSRILARHRMPPLAALDPITGQVIRASKLTAVRYERSRPGELAHMDVKKLARIPPGGGWRGRGRARAAITPRTRTRPSKSGFDYVHSLVDDYTRLTYSEVLPDEQGATCAGFLTRAAGYFAAHGIDQIEELMTDNAWAYKYSLREVCADLGIRQIFIKPHCPGRTERSRDSTGLCSPSGPTGASTSATTTAPQPLRPGSSTTTLNVATAHSTDSHPISRLRPT